MKSRNLDLLLMLLRETFSSALLERRPEPTAGMDDRQQVEAFHEQGAQQGPLLPIYHFNALALSDLVPKDGVIVDLGSGSGQFLAYMAQRRPDVSIYGLDLSPMMISVGQEFLKEAGLAERVVLQVGDMTTFRSRVPARVDAVSTVFSLHHLPALSDLKRCLEEIAVVRRKTGCALWVFDHARPKHPRTPEVFPSIFTPDSAPQFCRDSCNSLIASFAYEELSKVLNELEIGGVEHYCARVMRLYQIHRLRSAEGADAASGRDCWEEALLQSGAENERNGLKFLFPKILMS